MSDSEQAEYSSDAITFIPSLHEEDNAYRGFLRMRGAELNSGPWPDSYDQRRAFFAGWSACLYALISAQPLQLDETPTRDRG